MTGETQLGRRSILTALACALAVVGSACAPSDAGDPAPSPATEDGVWEVKTVPMPDISRLEASVQDQVRERYAALEEKTTSPSTSARDLARAHGDVGLILMATGLYGGAETSLRNAQALAPNEPRWPYYLGQLHLTSGDRAGAPEFFERALELRPTDLPTIVKLGETYLEQARPDDAERLFRQARQIDPRSAAALEGLGQTALADGDQAAAADFFEQALALEPAATRLHYPLAVAYRGLGEVAKADAHLERRGDGEPRVPDPLMQEYFWLVESAEAYLQRGALAMDASEFAAAASVFRRGLAIDPDSAPLGHALGLALYWNGEGDAAATQFAEVLQRSPDHTETHISLGVLFAEQRRYGEALARFAAAAEYDPSLVDAHVGQAEMRRNMGQLAASVPHWQRVVELAPADADAWIEAATALTRLERYEDARDWLSAAREIHPTRPELRTIDETVEAVLALRRELRP